MTKEERALEAAKTLRDFCAERNCSVCPFVKTGIRCRLLEHVPANWSLPIKIKKPAGVGAPTSCGDDSFDPITPEDNTFSEV